MVESKRVLELLKQAKRLAKEYYALTRRPLGVTGEVAEYEAVRLLGLELSPVRHPGYDAVRRQGRRVTRIQIKGRCILPGAKPGQRIGRIDLSKDFDSVVLVLLDEDFNATEIYEATREAVSKALLAPGSRSRNERGALGVSKFKVIGRRIWPAVGPPNKRVEPPVLSSYGTIRRRGSRAGRWAVESKSLIIS